MFLNGPIDKVSQTEATASSGDNLVEARHPRPIHSSSLDEGEKTAEYQRTVPKFIVEDLQPFTTVKSSWLRYACSQ